MILHVAAWDNGFGDDKFVFEKELRDGKGGEIKRVLETLAFPSTYYEVAKNSILTASWHFMNDSDLDQLLIEYDGVTYGVGNYAIIQDATGGSRNFLPDKFRDKTELIKLLAALAHTFPDDNQIIVEKLVCGLSLESFFSLKDELEATYANKRHSFKIPVQKSLRNVTVDIKECQCIPQGLGAFYDRYLELSSDGYVLVNPANAKMKDMRFGLVDVGEKTIDAFIAQGRDPIDRSEVVLKRGIAEAYAAVAKKCGNAPANIVQQAFIHKKDSLFWAGKNYTNLIRQCEEAFAEVARDTAQKLISAWKTQMDRVQMILLCGASAEVLKTHLQKIIPTIEIIVMENPRFSNARGYFKLGMLEYVARKQVQQINGTNKNEKIEKPAQQEVAAMTTKTEPVKTTA